MNILVTGASGHLGKYLIEDLTERYMIRALLLSPDETSKIENYNNIEIVYGDLTDPITIEGITKDIDVVIHLAAVIDYIAPENTLYKVNYEGTKNVIRECAKTGVKKFIYISSTAVYGKNLPKEAINEDFPLKPNNAYGKSKMLAEQELLKFKEKMNVIILRLSMLYGKGFDKGYFYILRAIEKKEMKMIGNGENHIPLLHVKDAVEAIKLSLENKTQSGSVYNVANQNSITQKELLTIAANELNVDPPTSTFPIFLVKTLASFELIGSYLTTKEPKLLNEYIDKISADRQFSIHKIEMDLGFFPKVNIKEGMKEMVEYYIEKEYEKEEIKEEENEVDYNDEEN
ncbi:MAG: NAD-dependent epimerase/dehydratase family protein [Candidatus Micrarchaeia archaeon]|jgi:nucleoside-diphosphate-sugar epimerase